MSSALIVWIYGLSGVGKSTIGRELANFLRGNQLGVVEIDGDVVRDIFGNDLGFDLQSRQEQIRRIQILVKALESQQSVILVTALYSNEALMKRNRELYTNYFEVYLSAPYEILCARDTKGLYSAVMNGETKNVVGADLEWNPPNTYDLNIDTSTTSANDAIAKISSNIKFMFLDKHHWKG